MLIRLVILLLVSSLASASHESVSSLQEVFLRLQLESQLAKLKPNAAATLNSSLPEAGLSIEELISYYGYPSENHEVVTEDGYILTVQRIPYGRFGRAEGVDRPVVLLMPGLVCNAGFFLSSGVEQSLGFWLADQGYDVWIANYRGTTYSRRHLTLDPDDDKSSFWDFSFDEIGYYDIPAFIDYILATTNQQKLFYVGHSQGSTAFFAMASQRPEYNAKIRLMVALAPVAFISNTEHPVLRPLAESKDILNLIAVTLQFYEVVPHWDFITKLGIELCSDGTETQEGCVSLIKLVSGITDKELNKTLIPLLLTHAPAGTSVKQLMHFAQEILSGHFRKYDYGLIGNLIKYGKLAPPDFALESVTAPVALFYCQNDWFANLLDVELLVDKLPNLVHRLMVEDEEFTHMGFGVAVNAVELVYEKLLDVFDNY